MSRAGQGHPRQMGHGESSDRTRTAEGNHRPPQYSRLENPINSTDSVKSCRAEKQFHVVLNKGKE